MPLPLGKLPADFLTQLLAHHRPADPRVVVGPGLGLDTAVLDFSEKYLVAKTDPITFATDAIGWYAVNVNANDVACAGAQPEFFLATVLLPENVADERMAAEIFDQIAAACTQLGASLVGGHTEITYGIDRPIVVGTMLGEVDRDKLVTAAGARPGDVVIITKGIPVEATAIIAREKADELAERFSPEFLAGCRDFLYNPGISVVRDALVATRAGRVTAMHDPTEGGLATGLWELAGASGHGLEVDQASLPILPEGQTLCEAYDLDPLAAIASGALLLTVPASDAPQIVTALNGEGIPAHVIGRMTNSPDVRLNRHGETMPLTRPDRDEIARLFE